MSELIYKASFVRNVILWGYGCKFISILATGQSLLDTCHSILVTWYLLHNISYLILVTRYLSLKLVTAYLLLDTCYSILVTWYMLPDTCYLILVTWYKIVQNLLENSNLALLLYVSQFFCRDAPLFFWLSKVPIRNLRSLNIFIFMSSLFKIYLCVEN